MRLLEIDQILILHKKMIEATGGLDGLRDQGLLESALQQCFQTFDGEELYPGIERKTAQLTFSLIQNHPFVDGNKRIGIYVMLIVLELNGIKLDFTQDELIDLGLSTAKGEQTAQSIYDWILRHQ